MQTRQREEIKKARLSIAKASQMNVTGRLKSDCICVNIVILLIMLLAQVVVTPIRKPTRSVVPAVVSRDPVALDVKVTGPRLTDCRGDDTASRIPAYDRRNDGWEIKGART